MTSSEDIMSLDLDAWLDRVSRGERLSAAELIHLAESPDILPLGMMADAVRRRLHGNRVTYVRVALLDAASRPWPSDIVGAAREVRVSGAVASLSEAVAAIEAAVAIASGRTVTGFSWEDVRRWAGAPDNTAAVLSALRAAGLDGLAELALDGDDPLEHSLATVTDAGFTLVRLTVGKPATAPVRIVQLLGAQAALSRYPSVATVSPLPMQLNTLRPTTGYDDVKAVALARLALPDVPHVQVDWLRYGPKLAQVALTFGVDDIDNVTASEDAPDGRRRAPVEELRRNVESAGLVAIERDGRLATLD